MFKMDHSTNESAVVPNGAKVEENTHNPNNNQAAEDESDSCICYRNKLRFVLCRSCGFIMPGRKRFVCPCHKNVSRFLIIIL